MQLVGSRQRRGAETFAHQLGAELAARGHGVRTVYLYRHDGVRALPLGPRDTALEGDPAQRLETTLGFAPDLLRRLAADLRQEPVDVLQLNGARTVKYGALLRRLRLTSAAVVYRNIGAPEAWIRGWRRRAFYRHVVLPGVDGVITVSRDADATLRTRLGVWAPMEHIPNGVAPPAPGSAALRARLAAERRGPVILLVGSLTREKRVDRLLRAAALPGLEAACWWIVGDGPLGPALRAQAEAAGLAGRARFFGAQEELAPFYEAADVVVLTSDTEGTPAVLLEAGLAGRPVVATRVGGVPEVILDGETGLLVEREDEVGLASAIAGLLADEPRRRSLGERARDRVAARHAMPIIADAYERFYRRTLSSRSAT
ncbi:MAG: glycosyltransferase family 4 protein [Planctomycetes bacterium]|nr:glycosyltransferase family 4 protein [Planctomycetota bacterium]